VTTNKNNEGKKFKTNSVPKSNSAHNIKDKISKQPTVSLLNRCPWFICTDFLRRISKIILKEVELGKQRCFGEKAAHKKTAWGLLSVLPLYN